MTRPVLARTSSAASGLRFCGMIEEPVVNLSRQPHEARPAARSRSRSPRRSATDAPPRSTPPTASPARSRDRTPRRANWPSAGRSRAPSRWHARSIGNEVPASAAAPSGDSFEPLARIGKPAAVARRHLDIGQQMMAERDRLRGLQMGEARHHGAGMLQRALRPARAGTRPAPRRSRRWCRGHRAGNRSRPGRCASARCAAARRPGRSARPAGSRHSYGCLRARA